MKRLITLFVTLAMTFTLFAQNAKSAGLTDSDVKNWAKNYSKIEKEIEALGIDVNDVSASPAAARTKAEAILEKNGISGPNPLNKYVMISMCASAIIAETELDEETLSFLQMFGQDPLADLKANINDKDYNVVKANKDLVIQVYNENEDKSEDFASEPEFDFSTYFSASGGFSSDFSYEDEGNGKIYKDYANALSKAKGDCGLVYKTRDEFKASDFKKDKITATRLNIEDIYRDDFTATGAVDFNKKTINITFTWMEGSKKQDKSVKFNIKSAEVYKAVRDRYGDATEYVITTKEGAVLHFYNFSSFDGNVFTSILDFKGKPSSEETERLRWLEE